MNELSPQKEAIVSALRDRDWHCGSEWVGFIKDDRKRISELNEGYMAERGWEIIGEPCRGKACGKKKCPLYMRKAVLKSKNNEPKTKEALTIQDQVKASIQWFEDLGETEVPATSGDNLVAKN